VRVESGDNVLIGGFIIAGSVPKRVIIRALGPSLASQGVAGALPDPTLDLYTPDGSVVSNDNWRGPQEGEIIASNLAPSNELEAAIVAMLEPGAYTAIVSGNGEQPGVGLVEVYDLDPAAPATLANIATRGRVQTGGNVMIAGVILGGTEPVKVLIRARGPSLAAQGVSGALLDPQLELYDRNGNVVTNDNWRATQEAEIIATGLAPSNDNEAAILATLIPDAYTAIVYGKDDSIGVALIEAYTVP